MDKYWPSADPAAVAPARPFDGRVGTVVRVAFNPIGVLPGTSAMLSATGDVTPERTDCRIGGLHGEPVSTLWRTYGAQGLRE